MRRENPRRIMDGLMGVAVAALLLGAACTSERPISPSPSNSTLVMLGWDLSPYRVWIDMLDTGTDTIIGGIPDVGSVAASKIETSVDGRFAATIAKGEGIRVFDLHTLGLIGQSQYQGVAAIEFVSAPPRLFVIDDRAPSLVYDLTSMEVDTALSETYRLCVASPKAGEVIVITRTAGGVLDPTWDGVARLSTDNWAVIDSFLFVSPATNGLVRSVDAILSPDGETIYVLAVDEAGNAVFAFDLDDHSCLFRTDILTRYYSSIAISPDAREIWVTQGYTGNGSPVPPTLGHVLIVHARSGEVRDTVRTLGLRVDRPDEPFPLGALAFHPTEPKAYLCSGYPYQSLLVVNTQSHEVESILEMGPLYDIAIVPR